MLGNIIGSRTGRIGWRRWESGCRLIFCGGFITDRSRPGKSPLIEFTGFQTAQHLLMLFLHEFFDHFLKGLNLDDIGIAGFFRRYDGAAAIEESYYVGGIDTAVLGLDMEHLALVHYIVIEA